MKHHKPFRLQLLAAALSLGGLCLAQAQTEVSAVLAGHASLSASRSVSPPTDARPVPYTPLPPPNKKEG